MVHISIPESTHLGALEADGAIAYQDTTFYVVIYQQPTTHCCIWQDGTREYNTVPGYIQAGTDDSSLTDIDVEPTEYCKELYEKVQRIVV